MCPCPKVPLCVLCSVAVLDFVRWVFAAENYMVTVLGRDSLHWRHRN